jgi:hypothetical protein
MNDDVLAVAEDLSAASGDFPAAPDSCSPGIPDYLEDTYWWAYLHPRSIWIFEREWLVNLILWGNMRRLTQAVLDDLRCEEHASVLQVACVYGDFSNRLAAHLGQSKSRLHLVDIAPIQLSNAESKLGHHSNFACTTRTPAPCVSTPVNSTTPSCFSSCTSSRKTSAAKPSPRRYASPGQVEKWFSSITMGRPGPTPYAT